MLLLRFIPEDVLVRVLLGRVWVSLREELVLVLTPVRVLFSLVPTTRPEVVLFEDVRTDEGRED